MDLVSRAATATGVAARHKQYDIIGGADPFRSFTRTKPAQVSNILLSLLCTAAREKPAQKVSSYLLLLSISFLLATDEWRLFSSSSYLRNKAMCRSGASDCGRVDWPAIREE